LTKADCQFQDSLELRKWLYSSANPVDIFHEIEKETAIGRRKMPSNCWRWRSTMDYLHVFSIGAGVHTMLHISP
jgi:hypothetical protein